MEKKAYLVDEAFDKVDNIIHNTEVEDLWQIVAKTLDYVSARKLGHGVHLGMALYKDRTTNLHHKLTGITDQELKVAIEQMKNNENYFRGLVDIYIDPSITGKHT